MDERLDIKDLLNYSAIFGLVLVAFSLFTELLGLEESYVMSALQLAVIVGGIYFIIKKIRDDIMEGHISYGKVVRLALMVSFLGGIILGFYTYLSLEYFNKEAIDLLFEATYEELNKQGLSEEQIATTMTMYEDIYTPSSLAIMNVFMVMFTGFISSLLLGAILKNEPHHLPQQERDSSNE